MKEHITAEEAAKKLGYGYDNFLRIIREGRVPDAEWWQGYLIPADITEKDIQTARRGRPKKTSEKS
jgi:hypothetical protein